MRVAVHATGLADAKGLLLAGIDILAHMISDVDDELVALFKQHPKTAVLLALGGPRRTIYAPWIDPFLARQNQDERDARVPPDSGKSKQLDDIMRIWTCDQSAEILR